MPPATGNVLRPMSVSANSHADTPVMMFGPPHRMPPCADQDRRRGRFKNGYIQSILEPARMTGRCLGPSPEESSKRRGHASSQLSAAEPIQSRHLLFLKQSRRQSCRAPEGSPRNPLLLEQPMLIVRCRCRYPHPQIQNSTTKWSCGLYIEPR
jgi:hypothetical protein